MMQRSFWRGIGSCSGVIRAAWGRSSCMTAAARYAVEPLECRALLSISLADQAFFGGPGDQQASGVSVNGGAVYVAGYNSPTSGQASDDVTLGRKYAAAPGLAPIFSRTFGFGSILRGISTTGDGIYTAGQSYALTTDSVGGKEVKPIAAKFALDGSAGPGPGGATWVAGSGGTATLSNFFAYSGTETFNAAATAAENGSTVLYAAGLGQPNGGGYAYLIAKYDAAGNLLATATDSSVGVTFASQEVPSGQSVANGVTYLDGNAYAAGLSAWASEGDGADPRPAIWKYDPKLNLVWRQKDTSLDGTFNAVTSIGNAIYAVGDEFTPGVANSENYLIEKYDEAGNLLWSTVTGGAGTDVLTGVVGVGSQLFAVGYTSSEGAGGTDAVILSIDPATGAVQSKTLFGGAQDDRATAVATDGTDLYVVGDSRSFASPDGNTVGQDDGMLLRYTVNNSVSWTGKGDGINWTDPKNWSTGQLPGPADDVTINVPGSPTITLASGTQSIHSLTSSNPLILSGGTLAVATTARLSSNVTLQGGTIRGGTLTFTNNAELIGTSINSSTPGGILDGVSLNGDIDLTQGGVDGVNQVNIVVMGGLTINGTIHIGVGGILDSLGDQTIGTTARGTIALETAGSTQSGIGWDGTGTLTLGPGLLVRGSGAVGIAFFGGGAFNLVNEGTISADLPAQPITIGINPGAHPPGTVLNFTNAGTAQSRNGGILSIIGNLTTVGGGTTTLSGGATVSNLNVTGGTVSLTGTTPVTIQKLTLTGGTINGTAPLKIGGNSTLSGGTLAPQGGVTIPAGTTVTVSGTVTSTAPLNNAGTININSGTLELDGGGAQTGTFAIAAGTTLAFGGSAPESLAAGSVLSGTGTVRFQGSTVASLAGTYNVGATVVQDAAAVTFLAPATSGTLTVSGGTLTCGSAITTTAQVRPAANLLKTLDVIVQTIISGGDTLVLPGWTLNTQGSGLVFVGAGTVTLSKSDLVPGTLLLGGDVTFNASAAATVRTSGSGARSGQVDLGGTSRTFLINNSSSAGLSVSASMGDGSILKSGSGLLTVSGAGTYAGGATLVDGTVEVDNSMALGSGPITFAGGKLALGPGVALANPVSVAASDSISLDVGSAAVQLAIPVTGSALNVTGSSGGSLTLSGPIALQHDLDINTSVPVTVAGAIGGGFGLFKTGSGILTLAGSSANTFTGTAEVDAGTLLLAKTSAAAIPQNLIVNAPGSVRLASAGQLSPSSAVTLDSTSGPVTLDLGGFAATIGSLSVAGGTVASLGSASSTLTCSALHITGGKLDLGRSKLLVGYGSGPDPIATIRSYIADGPRLSTSAAGLVLGDADGVDGVVSGLASHTILVRPTLAGDANLDGKIDFTDLVLLASHYNTSSGATWVQGDFDRSGKVNFSDLVSLAANYGRSA